MSMRILLLISTSLAIHAGMAAHSLAYTVQVTNPGASERKAVPVVLDTTRLPESYQVPTAKLQVSTAEGDRVPAQSDDLDSNGRVDEVVFLVDLAAGEKKALTLEPSPPTHAVLPQKTDAIALPGWESEAFGYRAYGPMVIDLFARMENQPGLKLELFYAKSGKEQYDYHTASKHGIDMLHIGKTLGLAGVFFISGEEIIIPREPLQSRVLAKGPLRAVVEMTMGPFENDFGSFTLVRTASIMAGAVETILKDRIITHELKAKTPVHFGVGMKREADSVYLQDEALGLYLQWHFQGDDIGEAGIGLLMLDTPTVYTREDANNRYYVFQEALAAGDALAVELAAFGAWSGGGVVDDIQGLHVRGKKIAQRHLPAIELVSSQH